MATLRCLRECADYDSALFLPPVVELGPPAVVGVSPQLAGFLRDHLERHLRDDAPTRAAAHAAGGVCTDELAVSDDPRRKLPFFAQFLRPLGVARRLIAVLSFRGHDAGSIHLCRRARSRRFAQREAETIALLLPALSVASAALMTPQECPELTRFVGRFRALTPRERQVATLAAAGHQNREIAALLGSSPHTVHNHLKRIFDKLDVARRTELAVLMERAGCVPRGDNPGPDG